MLQKDYVWVVYIFLKSFLGHLEYSVFLQNFEGLGLSLRATNIARACCAYS